MSTCVVGVSVVMYVLLLLLLCKLSVSSVRVFMTQIKSCGAKMCSPAQLVAQAACGTTGSYSGQLHRVVVDVMYNEYT